MKHIEKEKKTQSTSLIGIKLTLPKYWNKQKLQQCKIDDDPSFSWIYTNFS